ncbi:glycosyltransferase family 4 protein [Dechloromonas sp. XY25]|uniref:Glycosyltransferase family 4 protein n=1 Tax=Dechloromonas hankyongensis TaxID=2908002 RepID=A0ABS9K2P1_9RHOO|nr:glycosyltransferase family 4 protein [Dechloromonas hankyongensis]MCG2577401.1 glycosyltransferase family 4 protein [Dechloromonas hankyongensis]
MKIALVAPVFERVPPKRYGGTERVISYLAEELVRQGHRVTLFATGDSVTRARLVPVIADSRRFDSRRPEWLMYQTMMLDQVARMAGEFDVIHFHTDFLHFSLARQLPVPHLTTVHCRLDEPELIPLYRHFADLPLVSISDSQRLPVAWAGWQGTVYHGLPADLHAFNPDPGDYFAFVGRISPEKRVDRAIDIARRLDKPLYIAAKVDTTEEAYFREKIRPLLAHPRIDFIGEVGEDEKGQLLGGAAALLFPIDWPEPFGLVMIESLACGTPVVAYRHGSVPEIMEDGVTGFVVDTQDEAVTAAASIDQIDRRLCRRAFEQRFTSRRMAECYVAIYRRLRQKHAAPAKAVLA